MLYWDGEEIAQCMAMEKFVARKADMAGKTDLEYAQADMVRCHAEDLWKHWPKLRFEKDQVGGVTQCPSVTHIIRYKGQLIRDTIWL